MSGESFGGRTLVWSCVRGCEERAVLSAVQDAVVIRESFVLSFEVSA